MTGDTDAMTPSDTQPSSRTARVLEASFTEGLEDLSTDEVRSRRNEALAERDYQSYLRRLIQARQDFLDQEQGRRIEGGEPRALVDRLIDVLALGPQGGSRGEALRLQIPPADIAAAERQMRKVLGPSDLAEPEAMSDPELAKALESLRGAERDVSEARSAVFAVHDRLQDELKRRYRLDPSEILTRL
jgi:hypothetical protein